MNSLTTNTKSNNTWRRVKGRFVAMACGLALAVSAAVAISGDLKSPSAHQISGASTRLPASISTGIDTLTQPQVAFYLVASDKQAAKVQEYEELAQWVRLDTHMPEPKRSVIVLQAGTPAEEASSRKLIDDAMAASNFTSDQEAPAFEVVDMRNQ